MRSDGDTNDPSSTLTAKTAVRSPRAPPRSPCPCADDDETEEESRTGEVEQPVEEAGDADEWLVPNELHALAHPLPDAGAVGLSLLLEADPHEKERDGREGVGEGVGHEGQRAGHLEERSSDGRADDAHGGGSSALGTGRFGQLLGRDDGAHGTRLGRAEDGGARALDEGDEGDDPEGRVEGDQAHGEGADGGGAHRVGDDHEGAPAEVIGRHPGRDGEDGQRQGPGERDQARLDRRVGQRKRQQRIGDGGGLRPGARQQLPDLEEHEVAVAPERHGGHRTEATDSAGSTESERTARLSAMARLSAPPGSGRRTTVSERAMA